MLLQAGARASNTFCHPRLDGPGSLWSFIPIVVAELLSRYPGRLILTNSRTWSPNRSQETCLGLTFLGEGESERRGTHMRLDATPDYNTKKLSSTLRSQVSEPFSIIKTKLGRTSKWKKVYKMLKASFILHFEVRVEVGLK